MLRARFDAAAARTPAACAIVDGDERIAYAELGLRADRLARMLAEGAAGAPAPCVAICLPNGWEFAAAVLAAAGRGALVAPFHPEWRSRELAWHASRVAPRVLVTRRDLLPPWAEGGCLPPMVILVDDDDTRQRLLHSADVQPPLPQPLDAPHVAAPTSGSTGRPRLALRSVRNLLAAVDGAVEALGLRAGMRELCVVPFHSTGGFDNCLLLPLLTGMTAVILPSFTPAAFAAAAARESVDVVMGSPFVYDMLLASGAAREAFATVATAVSFGAPMSATTARRCADELGLSIRQLYGSTETGVVAIQPAGTPFAPGLAGHPIRTADVRIVDDAGAALAPGATGRIVVRGPGVIAGYADPASGDEAIFRDGAFHSGDLGAIEPSGILMLRGRSKAMINVAGAKIDPVEVEHAIREHPAVADCVVRGVADAREREIVEATLVLRDGRTLTRREVIEHCRERLAEYKLPRQIVFAAALPIDAAGKRRKAWLPDAPG